ncbi:MAG: hypothetical protein CMA81_04250 [Euryarchaeota archaeon]|jgi:lipid-binding SYLF domain-containing protein|nr:hypothetical protein [Euryarchaeota archaeon]|tara:strand:- start:1145 stop:1528 length:384 start_codon:yes stop_codon:yes gene_type:complete
MAGALISNQTAGKGLIATLTGILGLYLTAAMWVEFNDALGTLFGPSIGVIIGTLVFLIYQDRKNVKEFTFGQDYTTSESTTLVKGKDGRYTQVDSDVEKGRNPVMFIAMIYFAIFLVSEISWSDLIF